MKELYACSGFIFKAYVDKAYEYDLHIEICSKGYKGLGYFSFYPELLNHTINSLEKIYLNLCGEFTMEDDESDYYISFKMNENGSLFIKGKIGNYSGDSIEFSNNADQTLVGNLIKLMRE